MKWQRASRPEAGLAVKNPADPVPESLVCAFGTACSSNTRVRSPVPLLGWLQTQISPPCQKALIGFFRHSLSQHPSTRHLQTVIGIMKFVAKLRLQQKKPSECACMVVHWDCALVDWLSQASRGGLKEDVWMDNHSECTTLVCDEKHVRKVRDARDVKECAEELKLLCGNHHERLIRGHSCIRHLETLGGK